MRQFKLRLMCGSDGNVNLSSFQIKYEAFRAKNRALYVVNRLLLCHLSLHTCAPVSRMQSTAASLIRALNASFLDYIQARYTTNKLAIPS